MRSLPREIQNRLEEKLGLQNFEIWIKPCRVVTEGADGAVTIEAPNTVHRKWLNDNYLKTLQEAFSLYYDKPVRVTLSVNPDAESGSEGNQPAPRSRQPEPSTLIPRYTFDNFVIGTSNRFAHAACAAVAERPASRYNPLFIYGGVGLGKTHLVNAVGHRLLETTPGLKVLYTTFEAFMNQLIASLRRGRDGMDRFKSHYRNIDVLILDDIQFITGKERTQEEFFHTFNSLYENDKQIIVTSDRFPKEIENLEDRLRNRFEWGLIVDIKPPDLETRTAILIRKAEEERITLPRDVADFLATNIWSNVRELEGALTRLAAYASLNRMAITIELAEEVLRDTLEGNEKQITVRNIQKAICDHFNVDLNDLKSRRKTKDIVVPRQIAMYLCRKLTSNSYPAIGAEFGGRDHSTVIHAWKKIHKKTDYIKATAESLERQLKN